MIVPYLLLLLKEGGRLVHKRPEGEVAAAGAPVGERAPGAGAKPEQPVCEQAVAFTFEVSGSEELCCRF